MIIWEHFSRVGTISSARKALLYPLILNKFAISTERALREGVDLKEVLVIFRNDIDRAHFLVGHNVSFDERVLGAEYLRNKIPSAIMDKAKIDTKDEGTQFCAIPGPRGFKWPSLGELHHALFNKGFDDAHDAAADVEATTRCFLELVLLGEAKFSFPIDAKLYESPQSYIKREYYIDLVSPDRLKTSKTTVNQSKRSSLSQDKSVREGTYGVAEQDSSLAFEEQKKSPKKSLKNGPMESH